MSPFFVIFCSIGAFITDIAGSSVGEALGAADAVADADGFGEAEDEAVAVVRGVVVADAEAAGVAVTAAIDFCGILVIFTTAVTAKRMPAILPTVKMLFIFFISLFLLSLGSITKIPDQKITVSPILLYLYP